MLLPSLGERIDVNSTVHVWEMYHYIVHYASATIVSAHFSKDVCFKEVCCTSAFVSELSQVE